MIGIRACSWDGYQVLMDAELATVSGHSAGSVHGELGRDAQRAAVRLQTMT